MYIWMKNEDDLKGTHKEKGERAEREMCNSGQKDHHDGKAKREVAFLG